MNGPDPQHDFSISIAAPEDSVTVCEILEEAAAWLRAKGDELWRPADLDPAGITADVEAGMYRKAIADGVIAGCYRFQTEDMEYWDDVPHENSAFIHRVAVRRRFAGTGLSETMIGAAKVEARSLGKRYLRLDCADRPKLRAVYERQGFRFHSIKVREPYKVARYEFEL